MTLEENFSKILPRNQQQVWKEIQTRISGLSPFHYYLAGGTALALQMGHRQSIDFDFFSQQSLLARPTLDWIEQFSQPLVRETDPHTLHLELKGVKISFISAYKYRLIQHPVVFGKIPLASIADIGLMKLLAITHRATLRDYLDLAAILRGPVSLSELLKMSRKKYGKNYNGMIPLKALVSFQDIEMEIPPVFDKVLLKTWKDILLQAVRRAVE